MSRILRTDTAERDLAGILNQLGQYSRRAMDRFARDFERACALYSQFPLLGQPGDEYGPNLRFFLVRKHVAFYQPLSDGILILRVVHGSRDLPSVFPPGFFSGGSSGEEQEE